MPKALITGITGQDGSYLAELLLDKGYEVHGLIRRSSSFNTGRIDHIFDRLHLHHGDMMDGASIRSALAKCKPDEIYNLAAQSHVKVSFDMPCYSVEVATVGLMNLLEAMRDVAPKARMYHASSSEMFGGSPPPQSERTLFSPRSPYACAKVYGYYQCINYRQAYRLHISNGVLFNHESPRRGETFVTRKITRAATRIKLGLQDKLELGDIQAVRDWGFAGDYVEAMWMMLQQPRPDDFVVATGERHTVLDFVKAVFDRLGLDRAKHVEFGVKKYMRPLEVTSLQGDASKARAVLGWTPKTSFDDLVDMMVAHDLRLAKDEAAVLESRRGA